MTEGVRGIAGEERTFWIFRCILIAGIFLLVFAALIGRCFALQVLSGDDYAGISRDNSVQERLVRPPRGVILSNDGGVLVTNRSAFDLTFLPLGTMPSGDEGVAGRLSGIIGGDSSAIYDLLRAARNRPFRSMTLAQGVSDTVVQRISEESEDLKGVGIEPRPHRMYPLGKAGAHLLGYIGEITEEELERGEPYDIGLVELGSIGTPSEIIVPPAEVEASAGISGAPRSDAAPEMPAMGDLRGRAGIERALDGLLRGRKGWEEVEVDALGQAIGRLAGEEPVPGHRVILTVDADIEEWAAEAFGSLTGGFAAVEPATGRILALHSNPSYDPNAFVMSSRSSERIALLSDTREPFLDRATQSAYPPGSTFKAIVMAAGLVDGSLSASTRFYCPGSYAGKRCWRHSGHGTLDLLGGFTHSCDVYFYHSGERVGIESIARTARALGLGERSGMGVSREAEGIIPTPEWERENVPGADGEFWGLGDLHNTAIGQGYVLVTPIQMARAMGALANGGVLMRSGVIEEIMAPDGSVVSGFVPGVESDLGLGEREREFIRRAFTNVVEHGTGRRARVQGVLVGGKTGTSENPHGEDHAWFICAAPMDDPAIAIAVVVENGGHGGSTAAPIARYVLERLAEREGWND